MNQLAAASLTLFALVGLLAAPAHAQTYRGAAGWSVGALYSTSLNDGSSGSVDLEPEIAPMVSFHVDHWWRSGRTGVRLQLGASQPELDWIQGARDIAVYTADVNLMVRLLTPSPENRVIPHLAIGAGGIWWLLGDGPTTTFADAGVVYDGEEGVVRLDVLRLVGQTRRPGEADAVWRPDPMTPEVELGNLEIVETRVDGLRAGEKRWRIEFAPGVPRPLVEIVLQYEGRNPQSWLIELLPYAPEAQLISARETGVEGRAARSVDLDALGRSDVAW